MEERTVWLIIIGCVFAVLLTCYITALVKSKCEEMTFTANGWDIAFLMCERSEDEGEFILLKYDKFLRSYIGYRVKMN